MRGKPRIFIGFGETSGYCSGLKKGFDEIGIESVCFLIPENRFKYEETGGPALRDLIRSIIKSRDKLQESARKTGNVVLKMWRWLARVALGFVQNVVWLCVCFWAVFGFDVFVFQGRESFVNLFRFPLKPRFIDLAILKVFGKRIIYVFHGTDSRPAYLNGSSGIRKMTPRQMRRYVKRQSSDVRLIEKYADYIVHYPLNTQLHRRKIISHECVGRPVSIPQDDGKTKMAQAVEGITIVHAPSDPVGKGSRRIAESIIHLREKGHRINFIELAGRTNEEVKETLRNADLVVDQMYYDVAISYFATEASFFGKAVVCGTYGEEEFEKFPEAWLPPIYRCAPENMENAIETLIVDPALRLRCGNEAKEYVEKNFGPRRVAENYLKLISGEVPAEWWFDPNSLEYCQGYGYSTEEARAVVRAVIQEGGESALCLDEKPRLKEKLVRFAMK